MAVIKLPRGLIVDLITPLKENGAVDGRGLGQHLDRVLPHVQAVLLAGPDAGEGTHLKPSQKEQLLDKTLVIVRGRVPVMMWISGQTEDETRETLRLVEKRLDARKYTGQAYWVDAPLFYHSNRGLCDHYRALASLTKTPFLLYNDPDLIRQLGRPFKRNNIRTNILKKLVRIEGIAGLVFRGDLDRAYNYQKAARSGAGFRMFEGDESHFLEHPGLSGVVASGANLAPRAWQRVTESSLGLRENRSDYPDSLQQVWEAGEYLRSLRDVYHPDPAPLIKQALSEMGILAGPTPATQVHDAEGRMGRLKELMKEHGDFP
jgi:dihydrodipicolinate synthase/N-acetylneuraminate lyase